MSRPVRVLHILGAMNHGGVESWLMALLRRANRAEIAMDFLVERSEPAAYSSEIDSLGAAVICCGSVRRPGYIRDFNAALRTHGPYDVLHSHVHWFSGLTTALARRCGIPIRIAHSHSNSTFRETGRGVLRSGYRMLMRRGIRSSATHLLAVSRPAADALFGTDWSMDPRARVLYCGVDFDRFETADASADRESARQEFGISSDEIVLGHVGSFGIPKNHEFLCSVAASARRCNARIRVLCVGVGSLQERIRARFTEAGVPFIFAGARTDIPRILRAMDVFVFPSLYEGLPLAVVEAQAAGLPCVVSTAVTGEVDVVPGLVRWLPLQSGADLWAETALAAAQEAADGARALAAMRRSPFSVHSSFEQMRAIYRA